MMAANASSTTARPTSPLSAVQGQTAAITTNVKPKFIDVGINLSDPVFRGVYYGKKQHEDDLDDVIKRAENAGCVKLMATGSDLEESRKAVQLARDYPGRCYATVGVHPCSSKSFDAHPGGDSALLKELEDLAVEAKKAGLATAFGEIGLDYDRLNLCPKEQQLKYFEAQLDLAVKVQLPLFLHSRAAHGDFVRLLKPRLKMLPKGGLVHSFTGTMEEMRDLVGAGLMLGVNGCSLKTLDNLLVVKEMDLGRIMLETDGPWCEIRPRHASSVYLEGAPKLPRAVKNQKWERGLMVKGRNEPATISHVAHVIANIKSLPVEKVCQATWDNSVRMFGLGEVDIID